MARASAAAENAATNAVTGISGFLALFTTDPTTSGASGEISGGAPAYARVAEAWATAAAGVGSNSGALTLNVPASTTVAYVGHFSLVTAGVYSFGSALGSSQTFNTQGTETFAIGADTLGST